MHLEQFVNQLESIYEKELESVVLYGSAASEEFSEKYSDYNILLILKQVTPYELKKGAKLVRKWTRSGNSAPIFFDRHHIRTSTDVFPIEFYDIKENHRVLHGSDPLSDIKIDPKNLRHQCESELKGKILQLRARFIEISDSNKKVAGLMMESLSSFLSIFKGILRLMGHTPERKKRAMVEQLAAIIEFSPNIFFELLNVREGTALLPRKDALDKFEDYLTELAKIGDFVDRYEA